MMKKIIPLLLVMQLGYAEDLQEGVTYSYPFFYDDSDAFEDEDEPKQAQSASKKSKLLSMKARWAMPMLLSMWETPTFHPNAMLNGKK